MLAWFCKQLAPSAGGGRERASRVRWGADGWLAVASDTRTAPSAPSAASALRMLRLNPSPACPSAPPSVGREEALAVPFGAAVTLIEWRPGGARARDHAAALATADALGSVALWREHAGEWLQEPLRAAAGAAATALAWSPDGSLLAVGTSSGGVSVCTGDGERLWARRGATGGGGSGAVLALEWAPDGLTLLVGWGGGGGGGPAGPRLPIVAVLSAPNGAPVGALALHALTGITSPPPVGTDPVALRWHCSGGEEAAYDDDLAAAGHGGDPLARPLAAAFRCGRVQLMRGVGDASPVVVDTGLSPLSDAQWSRCGGVLAVGGVDPATGGGVVQFYTHVGAFLSTLRVPELPAATQQPVGGAPAEGRPRAHGGPSLSWDPATLCGSHLAVTSGDSVLLAAVALPRHVAAVGEGAILAVEGAGGWGSQLIAVDARGRKRLARRVQGLIALHAPSGGDTGDEDDERCVLACWNAPHRPTGPDASEDAAGDGLSAAGGAPPHAAPSPPSPVEPYSLTLCDAQGAPSASVGLGFRPDHVAVAPGCVVALDASGAAAAVWETGAAPASTVRRLGWDPSAGTWVDAEAPWKGAGSAWAALHRQRDHPSRVPSTPPPPVACVTARGGTLAVAREDGSLHLFRLPSLEPTGRHAVQLRGCPRQVSLNCDCTAALVVGSDAVARLVALPAEAAPAAPNGGTGPPNGASGAAVLAPDEPRWPDVWAVVWADDAPDLWAACVRDQLVAFRGSAPDASQPLPNHVGLPLRYVGLTITCAHPVPSADTRFVATHDAPALAALRAALRAGPSAAPLSSAPRAVRLAGGHPRMWRLLADEALARLDWVVAERALTVLGDAGGLAWLDRVRALPHPAVQLAEVDAAAGRLGDAEAALVAAGRAGDAAELLGRYGRADRLLGLGGRGAHAGDPAALTAAHLRAGDFWAGRQAWPRAAQHYAACGALQARVACLARAGDYAGLAALADGDGGELAALPTPQRAALAAEVAGRLAVVGLAEPACRLLLSVGDARGAVACAARLQAWGLAASLASRYGLRAQLVALADEELGALRAACGLPAVPPDAQGGGGGEGGGHHLAGLPPYQLQCASAILGGRA